MAITNAQQYQQLVNKPANGKRPGYRGDAAYGKSSRSAQATSIGQAQGATGKGGGASLGGGRDKDETPAQEIIGGKSYDVTTDPQNVEQRDNARFENNLKKEKIKEDFINNPAEYSKYTPAYVKALASFNRKPNRKFFYDKVIASGKYPGLNYGMTPQQLEEEYEKYMSNRMAGKTDAYGNPIQGFSYNTEGDLVGNFIDNDGPDPIPFIPTDDNEDPTDPANPTQLISSRIIGSQFDPTFFAAEGGMAEENDPVGGIMDLESGRQMYFLGKLVKKATRAVKKIAKSKIGKTALLGALGYGLGGGTFFGKMLPGVTRGGQGLGGFGGLSSIFGNVGDIIGGTGLGDKFAKFAGNKIGMGILGASVLPLVFGQKPKDDFDLEKYYAENKLTPAQSVRGVGTEMDFYNYNLAADGGLMRAGYQEGGDAEPVAKKTMPLLDMDGKEKDYRETGGFVDMGRMERADDVPARLSKNEFVFTADAVRNAGEGDIDKGAEVMYNMMKNLESGGEVSEESQGLDGAREMFQTSQRLGEVI